MEIESIGFLIDRLVIANIKIARWNHEKLEERKREKPDLKKLDELQRKVDYTNEERVALKNAIDLKLKHIIETGKYDYQEEKRTYEGHM